MIHAELILLADGFTSPGRREKAVEATQAGVPWVHLRDHGADADAFSAAADDLVARLRTMDPTVRISVNGSLDVAERLDLDYHAGMRGPSPEEARRRLGSGAVIGFSAHEEAEVVGPMADVVDYFFFSPIFPTSSKPGHPGVGVSELSRICDASPVPVYALGGITPERVTGCKEASARGVAVLSGIMNADDPGAAAKAYLEKGNGKIGERENGSVREWERGRKEKGNSVRPNKAQPSDPGHS